MAEEKFVSIFPYNSGQYLHNIAFDIQKNKGVEVLVLVKLKQFLHKKNISVNTYDIVTTTPPYKCVYFDLPYPWDFSGWKSILSHIGKNVLICNESSLIIPFNYWRLLHVFFTKVYTWYTPLIDNKKYFHIWIPKSTTGIETKPRKFSEKKFLILINKNTLPYYPFLLLNSFGKELYSERIKAIEFFERTIPDRFNLYGRGWNKPKKRNLSERIFGYKKYVTYKGEIDNKITLLSHFKYCICFENLTNVDGYITEKIFDCLKAKCVPIYWGAIDIQKHIPKDCFIDFRDFGNYEELLIHLDSIDENTYNKYIHNIEKLLSNKRFCDTWFENKFAEFFLNDILGEVNAI
jgi:alpha(1,3/1,4) fucosyltransferase